MKYEMHHRYVGPSDTVATAALVAIVTGLPLWNDGEELGVWARLPERLRKNAGWYGRDFIETFRALGFDCSPDFRTKFDPDTRYPCLLRYRPTKRELVGERAVLQVKTGNPDVKVSSWWNVLVYYDGLVYDPELPEPWPLNCWDHTRFTITAMVQVWVGGL